jgi:cytochrome b6-f complex iron-sulfur subunit
MERQQFLKTLGISFATLCVGACFSDCSKKNNATPANTPPEGTIVSANLSELTAIGKKVVVGNIAIFRIAAGDIASSFIATESLCTHQKGTLQWNAGLNVIECQSHFAQFSPDGVNTRPPLGGGVASKLATYIITVADGKVNAKVA